MRLGLSNSNYKIPVLKHEYISDFTSDNDGWVPSSIQGTLTQTYDQDIPGGSGGGWMKNVYSQANTGFSGLYKANVLPEGGNYGQHVVCSYKLYLDGDWEGSDDVNVKFDPDAYQDLFSHQYQDLPQDTETGARYASGSWWIVGNPPGSWGRHCNFGFGTNGDDDPGAGAIFWIKDIIIRVYSIT